MDQKEKNRKKVKLGILAGITSASVLVGSTFDSPEDLLDDKHLRPRPVIEQIDEFSKDDFSEDYKKKQSKDRIRNTIYKIPVKIRTVLFLPLWFLGNGLIFLFQMLLKGVISPVGHIIAGFLLHNLILLGIIAICVKLLFPDLPLSKIFNIKTLLMVLLGSTVMSICDYFMPKIWDRYNLYRAISKFIIGLIVLLIIMKPFIKKKLKNMYIYEIEYDLD